MSRVLLLAGAYNLLWGGFVVLMPAALFSWAGMEQPRYPELWQCIGMIVGVYGIGYIAAAANPAGHWPIVLVGFAGKVFGPIGFAMALMNGRFAADFAWVILFNDLIWWVPFGLILLHARRRPLNNPLSSIVRLKRPSQCWSRQPRRRAKTCWGCPMKLPFSSYFFVTLVAPFVVKQSQSWLPNRPVSRPPVARSYLFT